MAEPILTIGIPTYNRPKNIQITVRSLLPQLNDRVKFVVYDNCSEIPVSELFTEEEKAMFSIIRNKVNIGGDANIAGVIYHADTKWVWDLGDDDYPLENAVATILEYVDKYPDTLMFNFNSYIEHTTNNFKELTDFCKYRYVYPNFLFISSGIYNRDKLAGDLFHYYKNLSSMVGQTIFVLKHLEKQDDICMFVKKKIVRHSVDNVNNDFMENTSKRIKEIYNWDKPTFARRSSLLFEEFSDRRKQLNSTLFKGIALEYVRSVFENNLPFLKKVKLFFFVSHTVGFFNLLRYNGHVIGQYLLKLVLPNYIYQKVKVKAKRIMIRNK